MKTEIEPDNSIVELSNGYVFAKNSVKCVSPIGKSGSAVSFEIIGVGFKVSLFYDWSLSLEDFAELRNEAVTKLLKGK